jgi:NhaA family Na+:H+ antiporter
VISQSNTGKSGSLGPFEWFLRSEVVGSVVLLLCTLAALFWANSPWSESYLHLLHAKIGMSWGEASFKLPLHYWINDGLMVVFFFVVGLEIKRELLIGHLSSVKKAVLPVMAALGGMIFPALIYAALNFSREAAKGWGIPMATDIAFSLGLLAVLGKRVPVTLKVFLTAAAIADDLGAVAVIALFYTNTINFLALAIALVLLGILYVTARVFGVRRMGILLLLALGVWAAIFLSGIHATVAGILVALVVPVRPTISPESFLALAHDRLGRIKASQLAAERTILDEAQTQAIAELERASRSLQSTGLRFEHYLHPVQAFFILPLFALANAGVVLDQGLLRATITPEGLGVLLGLCLGKPIGFVLCSWFAVQSGYANLPEGVNWRQICGVGCLAGIGFTMSLFVTELAFSAEALIANAKAAILLASCVSAIVGYIVLSRVLPPANCDQRG